jgi:hypothetical protein
MIATCRASRGRALPANYRGLYFTEQTVFDITPGQGYQVYEMALFNGGLILLVVDDTRRPHWYPAELFDLQEGPMPSTWRFAVRASDDSGTQAVWGHERLVLDEEFEDAITEQDPDALVTFWRDVVMSEESGESE